MKIDLENYRTSVSGLMLAIGMAIATVPGVPEKYHWIGGILAAVGSAGLGLSAKDAKTHSTLEQVEKATKEKEETK